MRMFGYSSLEELPELPRYKLDENKQIVIEDLIEEREAPEPHEGEEGVKDEEDNKNRKKDLYEIITNRNGNCKIK